MSGIHFELPFYYFFLFSLIGLALALLLYRKETKKNLISKKKNLLLVFLRWITICLILFLLLQPKIFTKEQRAEKPILIFAQDNSESITVTKDSSYFINQYSDSVNLWMNRLREDYDIRTYTFGNKCKEQSTFDFNSKATNLEVLYNEINNRFYSTNLSDVIIASDGLINLGKSSKYLDAPKDIRIHALLIGDTASYPDLNIKSIKHNKYTLLDNQFPIEVDVNTNLFSKDNTIFLYRNNKLVQQKSLKNLNAGLTKITFLEKASEMGNVNYKVSVKTSLEENNLLNNSKSTIIEVIDYSQKILILTAAPHPDIAALNWVLKDLVKSQSKTCLVQDFNEEIGAYDLIVFHKPFQNRKLIELIEITKKKEIPNLIITGNDFPNNSEYLDLIGMKNTRFKGISSVSAKYNEDFNLFNFEMKWNTVVDKYPPLSIPFAAQYQLKDNTKTLFFQEINGIKMPYPLIYFTQSSSNIKYGTVFGEGIWKWKMNEYQNFNNSEVFKLLFQKIIQYLKTIDNKSRLKISVPSVISENQSLKVYTEFYNASFELEEDANLEFKYSDTSSVEYVKTISQVDKHYEIDLYNLQKGDYNFTITAKKSGETFTKKGSFKVVDSQIEMYNTVANKENLIQISSDNKIFTINEMEALVNQLSFSANKKIKYHEEETSKDLIHFRWLILLIIIFPFTEWLMRKNNGLI